MMLRWHHLQHVQKYLHDSYIKTDQAEFELTGERKGIFFFSNKIYHQYMHLICLFFFTSAPDAVRNKHKWKDAKLQDLDKILVKQNHSSFFKFNKHEKSYTFFPFDT